MRKGDKTRQTVLGRALDLASEVGLEGLSIGELAKRAGLSKSGLYAHFRSKEDLQTQVLDTAAERFIDVVLAPALKRPRGIPRLEHLFDRWLYWESEELTGGCLFVAAAAELDDRPGPVRDNLVRHLRDMLDSVARVARSAIEEGHFSAELDPEQFAYDAWAILLAYQHYRRLLHDEQAEARARDAFARLVADARLD